MRERDRAQFAQFETEVNMAACTKHGKPPDHTVPQSMWCEACVMDLRACLAESEKARDKYSVSLNETLDKLAEAERLWEALKGEYKDMAGKCATVEKREKKYEAALKRIRGLIPGDDSRFAFRARMLAGDALGPAQKD